MIKQVFIVIVTLQVVLSQQSLTLPNFDSEYNNYEETIQCYLQQNAIKGSLIMQIYITDVSYIWENMNNRTNPQKAYQVYKEPVHVLLITDTRIDHSLYGQLVRQAFKDQPIKAVWVMVSNGCIKSCDQLKGFIKDLKSALGPDQTIGIYTGPQYWSSTFNTREGCPEIPLSHPLFFASSYFKQFIPFGGWKKAEYMHDSYKKVPQCKVYGEEDGISYYLKQ